MGREIKFRGYAVPGMIGSQWLYGFGVDHAEYAEHYANEIGRDKDWFLYTDSGAFRVHEKSIGQFTGLKDKNGKEIYEADISKREIFAFGEIRTFIGEVKMYEGCWWIDSGTAAVLLWNEMHELEVIGNIYENPELLEAKE